MTDFDVTEVMISHGGNFASRLGQLWRAADPGNRRKIKDAFSDFWEYYNELAEKVAEQKGEKAKR